MKRTCNNEISRTTCAKISPFVLLATTLSVQDPV